MSKVIGFIGLGAIGEGMARNLVEAGHEVRGCDVRPEPGARLAAEGGLCVATPAEAAAGAHILCVAVYNVDQAKEVLFGESGGAARLPAAAVVIMHTTMSPADCRALAEQVGEAGHLFVDAPVTGGVDAARAGTLTIMAAGPDAALAASAAAFDAMAAKVVRCGSDAGDAATIKAINQLLVGSQVALVAEALALASKAGADLAQLHEVISSGSAQSFVWDNWAPRIIERDFAPRGAFDIFCKDLGIVADTAAGAGGYVPLAATALQLFRAGAGAGFGHEGSAALVKVYERLCSEVE
jgi:3-hydroxyisobutyrate dehydrogenase